MISLKKHLDNWDDLSSRSRVSLATYIRVLAALETAGGAMTGGEGAQFQAAVREILRYLLPEAALSIIEKSGLDAEQAIQTLVEVINLREIEYKQIIRIMAEAGATMVQTGTEHSHELRHLASKVEAITRLDSMAEARPQLSVYVSELLGMAARVQEEGQAKAKHLEKELEMAREKLRFAAALAETDALTGLGNRRRAESAVQNAIETGTPLCVLLMDLNGFKDVNDTYGHAQGDRLLKTIALSVKRDLREADLVCRWGGDEFVAVMQNATLAMAEETATRIRTNAFGEFVLGREDENIQVYVDAAIGVAEHRKGENGVELLERADRLMYEEKARSKAANKRPKTSKARR